MKCVIFIFRDFPGCLDSIFSSTLYDILKIYNSPGVRLGFNKLYLRRKSKYVFWNAVKSLTRLQNWIEFYFIAFLENVQTMQI